MVVFSKYYGFIHTKNYRLAHRCSYDKELVIQALQRAVAQETIAEDIIHHSDRGSQYASHEYQKILKKKKNSK
ncbi:MULTISPECIES: DDE-type integrase/transposase/recombinase [Bacillus cereus group]|uniref:DDE-type integrase/transposase/recombinase n=1 Tax=Bacillus cereus group TaxID=86661 RepID=UPI003A844DCB